MSDTTTISLQIPSGLSESTSELLQGQILYEACFLDEDKITMETAVIQSDANLYKARVSLKTYCSSQLFFWREYHRVRQSEARERSVRCQQVFQ